MSGWVVQGESERVVKGASGQVGKGESQGLGVGVGRVVHAEVDGVVHKGAGSPSMVWRHKKSSVTSKKPYSKVLKEWISL